MGSLGPEGPAWGDMEDLSLHLLDIAENGINAGATLIEISILEAPMANRVEMEIRDNGRGMDQETLKRVMDPFFTSRTTRSMGLGLPLLRQAAQEANGDVQVTSVPGQGTVVKALFQADHWDRKPMGDMAETLVTLIAGYPERDFVFRMWVPGKELSLDTREIRASVEGMAHLTDPAVLTWIRDQFR